ncbi:MAG: hypothetical protein KatS3mg024_2593 [Armatimonadota bacterium]|nr:MAG: hypothetical protein KatS3mg024_2593 [Armatimonadota bacterium]
MRSLRILIVASFFVAAARVCLAQAHRPAEPPVVHPVATAPAAPAQSAATTPVVRPEARQGASSATVAAPAAAPQPASQPARVSGPSGWRRSTGRSHLQGGRVSRVVSSSAEHQTAPQAAGSAPAAPQPAIAAPAGGATAAAPKAPVERPSSSASQKGKIQADSRGENGLRRALGIAGSVAGLLARLALVLALAYLSIVALKFLYSRTGRPLKFGERLLQVEESAPLGGGAAVHLVRIGEQRWLVGTAQGQVNILSEVGGKGEAVGAPPSREDAPSLSGLLNPGLLRELTGKASRKTDVRLEAASPARAVSGELRQTSSFIDEMRARLQAGRSS